MLGRAGPAELAQTRPAPPVRRPALRAAPIVLALFFCARTTRLLSAAVESPNGECPMIRKSDSPSLAQAHQAHGGAAAPGPADGGAAGCTSVTAARGRGSRAEGDTPWDRGGEPCGSASGGQHAVPSALPACAFPLAACCFLPLLGPPSSSLAPFQPRPLALCLNRGVDLRQASQPPAMPNPPGPPRGTELGAERTLGRRGGECRALAERDAVLGEE